MSDSEKRALHQIADDLETRALALRAIAGPRPSPPTSADSGGCRRFERVKSARPNGAGLVLVRRAVAA